MTTITDKKQYPGEQYLNELITNIEFAARAPVEVVRAIAAELQKHRKAYANTAASKDGWISCSERMPDSKTAVLVAREFDRKGDWRMKWATYIPGHPDANDGWIIPGASWIPSHWMPLPEPPQEVNRG